jgi:hypothetical protein
MDEMRITKGTALWRDTFTPPTRRNLSAPVVDRSGSDNGGNFATTDMTDVATYRVGEVIEPIGSAIWDFDNTDDVITLGPSSGLGISDAISVFAWVKLDSLSGWNGIFGTYSGGNFVHLQLLSGGVNCYIYGATAAYDRTDGGSFIEAGKWAQVGITFGDNILTVYVDGKQMPTQVTGNGNPISTTTAVSIGRVYDSGRMLNGQMGNIQIYNARLNAQQVKENFSQQSSRFNPRNWTNRDIVKDGLMLWLDAGVTESYPGTGSSWYDISGQGNDGTLMNSAEATWSGGGEGGYFDFEADGSSSNYCQIGSSGSVDSSLQVQSHTLEAWINTESFEGTSGLGMVVGSQCDSCTATGLSMFTDSRAAHGGGPNCFHYQFGNGSSWTANSSYGNTASGTCALGVWIHIVVCWTADGTSRPKNVYKNGAFLSSEGSYSSSSWVIDYGGTSWRIGSQQDIPGRAFDGKIAVARIYNRELSASEIEQNFQVQRQRFGV